MSDIFGILLSTIFLAFMLIGLALLLFMPILTISSATLYFGLKGACVLCAKRVKSFMLFLFSPESRRVLMRVPLIIETDFKEKFFAQTFDLSQNGLFVNLVNAHLLVGHTYNLKLALGDHRIIRCKGEVVRESKKKAGPYPAGIAMRLKEIGDRDQKILARTVTDEGESVRIQELRDRLWFL